MVTQPTGKPDFSKVAMGKTPLKEFKGRLVSHDFKQTQWGPQVVYTFNELEVIASDVPYLMPIAELSIRYSESESGTYGLLGKSLAKVMGLPDMRLVDTTTAYGKVWHMLRTDGWKFGEKKIKVKNELSGEETDGVEELTGPKWEVVGIEGFSGAEDKPALTVALELLEGSNEGDFYRAALQNAAIKADSELTSQIMDQSFISAMTAEDVVSISKKGIHMVDWDKVAK